jgi:predicted adenine nucleotide alpha hydrolase (AANH) superfamily ATPase
MEHQRRLDAFKNLVTSKGANHIVEIGYDIAEYFRSVAWHEMDRCRHCFKLRLDRVANVAALTGGFDAFSTTLLISPHQKHGLIKDIGESIARQYGVEFGYADLRKRFSDSRRQTKPMGLYSQQYCGCIYSEWERYDHEYAKDSSVASSPTKLD